MSKLSEMPVVTVEQVVRFREAALECERALLDTQQKLEELQKKHALACMSRHPLNGEFYSDKSDMEYIKKYYSSTFGNGLNN